MVDTKVGPQWKIRKNRIYVVQKASQLGINQLETSIYNIMAGDSFLGIL